MLTGMELKSFAGHGEQLVPHAHEAANGEHRVKKVANLMIDHQFVALARILIPAIDHHPGSLVA